MEIVFYSSPGCKWCLKAQKLLELANVPYEKYTCGKDITYEEVENRYPAANGYPIIVVDGNYLGGIHELAVKLVKEGLVNSSMIRK